MAKPKKRTLTAQQQKAVELVAQGKSYIEQLFIGEPERTAWTDRQVC